MLVKHILFFYNGVYHRQIEFSHTVISAVDTSIKTLFRKRKENDINKCQQNSERYLSAKT